MNPIAPVPVPKACMNKRSMEIVSPVEKLIPQADPTGGGGGGGGPFTTYTNN